MGVSSLSEVDHRGGGVNSVGINSVGEHNDGQIFILISPSGGTSETGVTERVGRELSTTRKSGLNRNGIPTEGSRIRVGETSSSGSEEVHSFSFENLNSFTLGVNVNTSVEHHVHESAQFVSSGEETSITRDTTQEPSGFIMNDTVAQFVTIDIIEFSRRNVVNVERRGVEHGGGQFKRSIDVELQEDIKGETSNSLDYFLEGNHI